MPGRPGAGPGGGRREEARRREERGRAGGDREREGPGGGAGCRPAARQGSGAGPGARPGCPGPSACLGAEPSPALLRPVPAPGVSASGEPLAPAGGREGGAGLERESGLRACGSGHAREERRRERKAAPSTHPSWVPACAYVTRRSGRETGGCGVSGQGSESPSRAAPSLPSLTARLK